MGRYSIDLRQKVVTAYKLGKGSIRQIAEQFMISPATVHSYIKQDRETQDLTPKKPGSNRPGKLEAYRDFIIRMVQDNPDWKVRQYREYLLTEPDVYVSVGGMCEFLNKLGLGEAFAERASDFNQEPLARMLSPLQKNLRSGEDGNIGKVKNSELITGRGLEIYQRRK